MTNLPQTYDLITTITLISAVLSLVAVVMSLLSMRKAEKTSAKTDNILLSEGLRRTALDEERVSRIKQDAILQKNMNLLSAEVSNLSGAVLNASATLEDLSKKEKKVKRNGKRK